MCGEQCDQWPDRVQRSGSPPRVRGTEDGKTNGDMDKGITPACAGNRILKVPMTPWKQDHPRVCGEQSLTSRIMPMGLGSPPRVRGTEERRMKQDKEARITPACAGNSCWNRVGAFPVSDHPRVCGEQDLGYSVPIPGGGSPPRVRGTACTPFCTGRALRITPACAGNRLKKARHFYILFCQIKRIHLV